MIKWAKTSIATAATFVVGTAATYAQGPTPPTVGDVSTATGVDATYLTTIATSLIGLGVAIFLPMLIWRKMRGQMR